LIDPPLYHQPPHHNPVSQGTVIHQRIRLTHSTHKTLQKQALLIPTQHPSKRNPRKYSTTKMCCLPFPSSDTISIVDDNAKGHQNPNTFDIVQAHTKCCFDYDVGTCRWQSCFEHFSAKAQHMHQSAASSSSRCLPKLPQRKSSAEGREQPQRPQEKVTPTTFSGSSCCSSSSGSNPAGSDIPLRRPTRQSSLTSQSSLVCLLKRRGHGPAPGPPPTPPSLQPKEQQEPLPQLLLWSRCQTRATMTQLLKIQTPPSPPRRPNQIYSKSA